MKNLLFISIALLFTLQSVAQAEIRSEEDWDKVIITDTQTDVDGLIKGETLKAKTTRVFYKANKKSMVASTLKELQKEAALNGYSAVLILKHRTHKFGKDKVISRAVGVGYSYN
jgi:hypothetical protein